MTTTGAAKRLLGPTLILTAMVTSVISSLGAPLISTVARKFGEPLTTAQWSLTVALLAGAVASPVLGRLADGRRRREIIIGTVAVVTIGGIVAALAGNLAVFIVGRALQGTGLGLVPLTMATARDELPKAKVPGMIAVLSVSAAAGIGAGYPLSGLLAEAWGLTGAFWFGAGVCVFTLVCVAAIVPSNGRADRSARLNWPGAVLLAIGLVAVLLALAEGAGWGWASAQTLGCLVGGAAVLCVWAGQQLRTTAPLVELRLVRHPAVLAADVCALVLGLAMYMNLSAATEFVQSPTAGGFGFGASALMAGVVLLPLSVLMLSGSWVLPRLVRWMGARRVVALGCLVVGIGGGYFALWHAALWQVFIMMGILGIGLGLSFAAIPGLIVQAVPARETGSAMGFYTVVRYVGFSTGSALTAAVIASHSGADHEPTAAGFTMVFWISAVVGLLAAVLAYVMPARAHKVPATQRLPEDEITLLEETEGDDYLTLEPR